MTTCVWRATGSSFDVDAFLAAHPEVHPDTVWHRGERQWVTISKPMVTSSSMAADLQYFADIGVSVSVTAYACVDD
jgi:hypothetical protein